jgi:deoxyribodipyrimidine photolyase-like uncharacterized protein
MTKHAHDGDCTIYASLENGLATDGVCTCGYGQELARKDDWSEMFSAEFTDRVAVENWIIPQTMEEVVGLLKARIKVHQRWADWLASTPVEETAPAHNASGGSVQSHEFYIRQYKECIKIIRKDHPMPGGNFIDWTYDGRMRRNRKADREHFEKRKEEEEFLKS